MELIKKLNKIQQELKAPKNQKNNFGNYKYRSCEDILEAVKPLLVDCVLTIEDEMVSFGTETDNRFYVQATAIIRDDKDKIKITAYAREAQNKKKMDEAQITGSASSYARKYALNGLFLIDDTKDADTMNNTPQTTSNNAKFSSKQQSKELLRTKVANEAKHLKKFFTEANKLELTKEIILNKSGIVVDTLKDLEDEETCKLIISSWT